MPEISVEFVDAGCRLSVAVNGHAVGELQRNDSGDWCYFAIEPSAKPALICRDLDAAKQAVTAGIRAVGYFR